MHRFYRFILYLVILISNLSFNSKCQVWKIADSVGYDAQVQIIKDGENRLWCFWKQELDDWGVSFSGKLKAKYFKNSVWSDIISFGTDTITGFSIDMNSDGRIFAGTQYVDIINSPETAKFFLNIIDTSSTTHIDSFFVNGAFRSNPKIMFYDSQKMIFYLGGDSFGDGGIPWRFAHYTGEDRDSLDFKFVQLGGIFCSWGDQSYYAIINNGHYIFMNFYSAVCHGGFWNYQTEFITDLSNNLLMSGNILGGSPTGLIYSSDSSFIKAYKFIDSAQNYIEVRNWILNFKPQLISTNNQSVIFTTLQGEYPYQYLMAKKVIDTTWYQTTMVNLDSIDVEGKLNFKYIYSEDSSFVWLCASNTLNDIFVVRIPQTSFIDTLLTNITDENRNIFKTKDFRLYQNYPNPFNPATDIRYQISEISNVSLKIFDVLGREIATLVNELKQPGEYKVLWNAEHVPSGVYFYRLQTDKYNKMKKMLLLR
jgi:hypothetical protein